MDEIFPTTIPVIHKIIEQTSKTSTVARNIINNEQLWLEEISATQTVRWNPSIKSETERNNNITIKNEDSFITSNISMTVRCIYVL